MRIGIAALVAAWLVASSARAQSCVVSGREVEVHELELRPGLVARRAIVDVDVAVSMRAESPPTELRLLRPIEAPARAAVGLGVHEPSALDPAFFEGVTPRAIELVRVVPSRAGALVEIGSVRIAGAAPRYESLQVVRAWPLRGADDRPRPELPHQRAFASPLRLFLDHHPRSRSIGITHDGEWPPLRGEELERYGDWVRLAIELERGMSVRGWIRERDIRAPGPSGSSGLLGGRRRAERRRLQPTPECYVGPAWFAARAPIFASERDVEPWGFIVDGAGLIVRDCHEGARVEIIEAFDQELAVGWVDATSIARIGAMDCGDLRLTQDVRTLRVYIGESRRDDVAPADEIVRIGMDAVRGPPFDTVTPIRLDAICGAYLRGERVVVDGPRGRREIRARQQPP